MNATPNLERKKRYSRWRAGALISVYVLMGIHIAHWKIAGSTLAPLELNEVLYTLHLGIITAGFIFMGITLLGSIIFGRFFCSWMCHILALQDFSEWLLAKLRIKPKPINSRAFLFVPVAALLYLFVWPQVERVMRGEALPALHMQTDSQSWASFITNDFWRNLPSIPITMLTFFVCGFVIIYFLGTRSFCQQVCPYGVLFSFADKFAPGKIKLTGDCTQCGICTAHCSSHILIHKEIEQFGQVVNSNCLKDLDCVAVCPEDAIKFKFTKPAFFKTLAGTGTHKTHYNFSFAEDILLALLTLIYTIIFRGLYDTVPFLLAITLAVVFSYFSVLFFRMFRVEFVPIGKVTLSHSGKITTAGKYFAAVTLLIFALSIHSAYVHYHSFMGDSAYNKIIKQGSGLQLYSNSADANATLETALAHLNKASAWGIYSPLSLNRELAAIHLYNKDYDKAEKYLIKMLDANPKDWEARLRLAKLMYVSSREEAASDELRKILSEDAEIRTAHDLKIRSDAYLMMGHVEEKTGFAVSAMKHYVHSLKDNPENVEAMLALGIIYTQSGNFAEAEKYLAKCNEVMPNTPLVNNNLSLIYIKLKKRAPAIYHLKELTRLQPDNAQAQYNLGMLLYSDGKKAEAMVSLQKAVNLNPDYLNAQIGLTKVLDDMGQKTEAEAHRQKAEAIKSAMAIAKTTY